MPAFEMLGEALQKRCEAVLASCPTHSASCDPSDDCAQATPSLSRFFTCHEGLLLGYEEALTRPVCCTHVPEPLPSCSLESHSSCVRPSAPPSEMPVAAQYASSAHFLWIGDRTRDPAGAHVEFFRGIGNPIGVKVRSASSSTDALQLLAVVPLGCSCFVCCVLWILILLCLYQLGPSSSCEDVRALVLALNPHRLPGRLTLITRYGCAAIERILPQHVEVVRVTLSIPCCCCRCVVLVNESLLLPQTGAANGCTRGLVLRPVPWQYTDRSGKPSFISVAVFLQFVLCCFPTCLAARE
jgi:hypothetical protein